MALMLMLVLFFVVASVLQVAITLFCGSENVGGWMLLLGQVIIFAGPALLWAALYHEKAAEALRLRFADRYWLLALAGMACFALLSPLVDALAGWNAGWRFPAALKPLEEMLRQITDANEAIMERFLRQPGVASLLFNLFVIAFVPAVCEELFFRGALQTALARALRGPHWAILLTSVVFSLAHGDIFGFVPRLLMGMALGYLFHYGGSLLVNACAHFLNNAVVVVFYYLYYRGDYPINPSEGIGYPGWAVAVTAILSVTIFVVFFVIKCKNSMKKDAS